MGAATLKLDDNRCKVLRPMTSVRINFVFRFVGGRPN